MSKKHPYSTVWTTLRKQNIARYMKEAQPRFDAKVQVKSRPSMTKDEHAFIPFVEIKHPSGKTDIVHFKTRQDYVNWKYKTLRKFE